MSQDWLYEDGEDEVKSVYTAKLNDLKTLGGPVEMRYREAAQRPAAIASLQAVASNFVTFAQTTDPAYNHIAQKDRQSVGHPYARLPCILWCCEGLPPILSPSHRRPTPPTNTSPRRTCNRQAGGMSLSVFPLLLAAQGHSCSPEEYALLLESYWQSLVSQGDILNIFTFVLTLLQSYRVKGRTTGQSCLACEHAACHTQGTGYGIWRLHPELPPPSLFLKRGGGGGVLVSCLLGGSAYTLDCT